MPVDSTNMGALTAPRPAYLDGLAAASWALTFQCLAPAGGAQQEMRLLSAGYPLAPWGFVLANAIGATLAEFSLTTSAATAVVKAPFTGDGIAHRLAVTYDNANLILWLDSATVDSRPLTGTIAAGSYPLTLMGWSDASASGRPHFVVDAPAIWANHALSPAEVAALASTTPDQVAPSSLKWYPTLAGAEGSPAATGDAALASSFPGVSAPLSVSGTPAYAGFRASGFAFVRPPGSPAGTYMGNCGSPLTVTAALAGGTSLTSPLVITLTDPLDWSVAATLTIPPGSTSDSATFTPAQSRGASVLDLRTSFAGGGLPAGYRPPACPCYLDPPLATSCELSAWTAAGRASPWNGTPGLVVPVGTPVRIEASPTWGTHALAEVPFRGPSPDPAPLLIAVVLDGAPAGTISVGHGDYHGSLTVTPTGPGTHVVTATHTSGGFAGGDGSTSFVTA